MAGTAQAAELIHCDRCSGHYVVDASGDGKPRVRCNKCGHLRETAAADISPASVVGKWTVIGPDGKAMSFDTWEELTESRRPSAITATAKAVDETKDIPKDRKSASALLDITPEPHKVPEKHKLALADMDSEIDLGGSGRPKRTSTLTSTLTPGSSKPSGRMEPLAIPSFSQAPKSAGGTPKVEWAPKIEKAKAMSDVAPRGDHDHTLRVEMAPPTARVIEAERPTAPSVTSEADDESIDELDADSLIEDAEDYASEDDIEPAPLSLRDAIESSGDVLADDDLQDDDAPDPHEHLSLRDLVVVPAVASNDAKASPAPPQVVTEKMPPVAPKTSVPPPRPQSLSRPDLPRPPLPSLSPEIEGEKTERTSPSSRAVADMKRRAAARAAASTENKSKRGLILGGIALLVVVGVVYRLATPGPTPPPPPAPKPPVVATQVPPTPVTTPAPTPITAPPQDTAALDLPTDTTSHTPPEKPEKPVTTTTTTTQPTTTAEKPVTTTTQPTTTQPATTTAEKPATTKPTVANTDSPGSMSDLLDKAGAARRKGDFATARDLYQRVIAMAPTNVEANGGLGDVARAQGDLAGAKASYERALAASPTYTPAQLGLADVEWDQGNKPSAIKRYSAVVDRMGDRAPQRAKERAAH